MDHSHTPLSFAVPDMSRHEARERLEDEITELAAHINAANYDLLVPIGRYDADKGWVQRGLASCAHWLQWRCERQKLIQEERRNHALRELGWHIDDDGCWVMKGRFTPD